MRPQRNAERNTSPSSALSIFASVTSVVNSFFSIRNAEPSPFLISEEVAHDR